MKNILNTHTHKIRATYTHTHAFKEYHTLYTNTHPVKCTHITLSPTQAYKQQYTQNTHDTLYATMKCVLLQIIFILPLLLKLLFYLLLERHKVLGFLHFGRWKISSLSCSYGECFCLTYVTQSDTRWHGLLNMKCLYCLVLRAWSVCIFFGLDMTSTELQWGTFRNIIYAGIHVRQITIGGFIKEPKWVQILVVTDQ